MAFLPQSPHKTDPSSSSIGTTEEQGYTKSQAMRSPQPSTAKAAMSWTQRIWMAGNYANAEEICRVFCRRGMCVSIAPMNYIYTGGEESGFCVTLINYPRFPKEPVELKDIAFELAMNLMNGLHQQSFTIEGPEETLFFSVRPEDT